MVISPIDMIQAELKCIPVLFIEMDSQTGQVPEGWCQTSRPGELVPHIVRL